VKADTRFSILLILQVAILAGLGFLFFQAGDEGKDSSSKGREFGGKLKALGLNLGAISQYEKFLSSGNLTNETRANISFVIAELFEKEGQYEKALEWYVQVEGIDPKSKYRDESARKMVALLEKLNKSQTAKALLREKTQLANPKEEVKGAKVLAQIGDKKIYDYNLAEAINLLPPALQEQYQKKESKLKFLQQYVAEEALHQKALRLGHNNLPEINKKVDKLKRQVLIQKVIEDEVQNKITVDEQDLKNYFKANPDRFSLKDRAKVVHIKFKDKNLETTFKDLMKKGTSIQTVLKDTFNQDYVEKEIERGMDLDGFQGEQLDALFEKRPTQWIGPFLKNGFYSIFYLKEKTQGRTFKFEEIKSQVEATYKMEKGQNIYQKLLSSVIQSGEVKFFQENLQ
jgi:tetratricopeptide (TPR) repeat protein